MSDAIDIHDPVYSICERLGVDPRLVAMIVLTPTLADVTVYLLDDNGDKYLDPDTYVPATRIERFEVKT